MRRDESAFACEALPVVASPRRHARRGQLWTGRAGLGIAPSVAWLAYAESGVNTIVRLERVAVGIRAQPIGSAHTGARQYASADRRAQPIAPPHASGDAPPHASADR